MRECSIDGCNNEHKGHGFCVKHLRRFKKWGDPSFALVEKPSNGAVKIFYEKILLSDTDECVDWPFNTTKKGYPVYKKRDGFSNSAHRRICRDTYREPSDAKMDAAHSCGNKLCVNPKHLRWATRKENAKDRIGHGTNGKKLTLEQVEQIRQDKRLYLEIARDFNIHPSNVGYIKKFKIWKNN